MARSDGMPGSGGTRPSGPGLWRRLWERPSPAMAELIARGETRLAGIRVRILAALLAVPVIYISVGPRTRDPWIGAAAFLACFLLSYIGLQLSARSRGPGWISWASTLADVSFVSLAHVLFVAFGEATTAANSRVLYSFYFIAIFATCIRHDVRLSMAAGFAAVIQYSGIVVWIALLPEYGATPDGIRGYGTFSTADQGARIILLLVAGGLATTIVYRTRELLYLSTIDPLTGLFNRGYLEERLAGEVGRSRRTATPLSVAMVDLDRFKQVNDTHGHAAGDEALRAVAGHLRARLRRSDVLARFGGEEFLILLPGASAPDVAFLLERLRLEVERLSIPSARDRAHFTITFSAGVASFPGDGGSGEDLIRIADQRLYMAKAAGRNRVISE